MDKLSFSEYSFKTKWIDEKQFIFDPIRKKYVVLTPEEWVRQNFIQFLINERNYPPSLLSVEMSFRLNKLSKRADVLVYNKKGEAVLIIECKSANVKITQDVFDQIARYNMKFNVSFLVVTNGLKNYCCKIDYEKSSYSFLKDIPYFEEL